MGPFCTRSLTCVHVEVKKTGVCLSPSGADEISSCGSCKREAVRSSLSRTMRSAGHGLRVHLEFEEPRIWCNCCRGKVQTLSLWQSKMRDMSISPFSIALGPVLVSEAELWSTLQVMQNCSRHWIQRPFWFRKRRNLVPSTFRKSSIKKRAWSPERALYLEEPDTFRV